MNAFHADFDHAPSLVTWESTRACDLAYRHLRFKVRPRRSPKELSTLEAMALMNRVRCFGRPHFDLTGGDPVKRDDVVELVTHGARIGLRMGVTPSATPLMTPGVIQRLADAGLARLTVSLDGSSAEAHDPRQGVTGSWARTLVILKAASDAGVTTRVATSVSRRSRADFDELVELMTELGVSCWSVVFPAWPGRNRSAELAGPEEFEAALQQVSNLSEKTRFQVESAAAPQLRRVVVQRRMAERRDRNGDGPPEPRDPDSDPSGGPRGARGRSVNDGNGAVFIGHTGEIFPSAFLPVSAGNVRTHDVVRVYRESELFRSLRNPDGLKGKCGVCEYRFICGGSRARAWTLTGDPLEADAFCPHVPAPWSRMMEAGEAQDLETYFASRIPGWRKEIGRPTPVEEDRPGRPVFAD